MQPVIHHCAKAKSKAGLAIQMCCLLALLVFFAGCQGIQVADEKDARRGLAQVSAKYRPQGQLPALPLLETNSTFSNFIEFAVLNSPQVAAAYYDWAASVESITRERSLPDPQLTFESDISTIVSSIMPGLMMTFPGPGKLKAAGAAASAESQARYSTFQFSVLQTVFDLKSAYYDLFFLDTQLDINRQTLALLADLETIARSQNEVGKATLQDVLRAQIDQNRTANELSNLEDSRIMLMARFKAALGLATNQSDPPLPLKFESTALNLSSDKLLDEAFAHNPNLQGMQAEVRRAEAQISVAYRERMPDTTAGLQADVKAAPVFYRPQLAITLPIWRDKLKADLAAAQFAKHGAEARLSAAQISLAVDLAEKSFNCREASRNLAVAEEQLLPKARLSLQVGRAAYLSGQQDFLNLIDAERALLDIQLTEVQARIAREKSLADISLLILGRGPAGSPIPAAATSPLADQSKP